MKQIRFFSLLLSSLFFLFSTSLHAAPPPSPSDQGDDIPLLSAEQEQSLDDSQQKASEVLAEAAGWIDSFFDDDRALEEENTSRGTLKLLAGYSRNDKFEFKPRIRLRIRLPKLKNKVHLLIRASDDDDELKITDNIFTPHQGNRDSGKNELSLALQYFLKETEKYNISTTGGVSWNYAYAGLRYRLLHNMNSWQGRFTDRLRYYTDDGWENRASYDLETRISDLWLFRSTTSVNLLEDEPGIPHAQQFRLYQILREDRALMYETGVYYGTDPSYKLTDFQIRVKYRQRFYRNWLVLQIAPQVTFPEDHDRKVNPGITFTLEATFGYNVNESMFDQVFSF